MFTVIQKGRLHLTVLPQIWVRLRPHDCADAMRPCRLEDCRYHLGNATSESCALDVTDRGPQSLREVGRLLGISNPMVHKIQARALRKLDALRAEPDVELEDEG